MEIKGSVRVSELDLRVPFDMTIDEYGRGRDRGKEFSTLRITWSGSWNADIKSGGTLTAYEKPTSMFIDGILDSGCTVLVYTVGAKKDYWRKVIPS